MRRLWLVLLLLGCGEPERISKDMWVHRIAARDSVDRPILRAIRVRPKCSLTAAEDSVLAEYWRGYYRGETVQRVGK